MSCGKTSPTAPSAGKKPCPRHRQRMAPILKYQKSSVNKEPFPMSPATPPIIYLDKIEKSYYMGKQALPILKGVSLEICRNEYVALMGPSGSGKSTLMN